MRRAACVAQSAQLVYFAVVPCFCCDLLPGEASVLPVHRDFLLLHCFLFLIRDCCHPTFTSCVFARLRVLAMLSYCTAYGCHSLYGRNSKVAFHKFPQDQRMAAKRATAVLKKILQTYETKRTVAVANLPYFKSAAALLLFPHSHAVRA